MKNDVLQKFELEKFYDELDSIISGFGTEGRIFSNEEQFQFELALEIERKYQKDEKGYPKIRLEVLSCFEPLEKVAEMSTDERDKMYTDIVVDINDSESIAIELKYKTLGGKGTKGDKGSKYFDYKTESGTYRVFNQGASNLGCAYYLADVARIEKLIARSRTSLEVNGFDLCHPEHRRAVVRGYAIIITNDYLYWSTHKEGSDAAVFSLTCDDKGSKEDYIVEGKGTKYPEIHLNNHYKFTWKPYYPCEPKIEAKQGRRKKHNENDLPQIGYLILQIPPKETN